MRRTYAILCLLASSVGSLAQDSLRPLPTPTPSVDERISVQTDLVVLTITVQDEVGRYVAGKKKSDFLIFDNNRPVEIEFFSDTDEPASLAPNDHRDIEADAFALVWLMGSLPKERLERDVFPYVLNNREMAWRALRVIGYLAWYHPRIRLANWLERACLALQEKGTA